MLLSEADGEQIVDLNVTAELAQLMKFTGDAATAIRMYSAYSGGSPSAHLLRHEDPRRDSVELMFLADALHHFAPLGDALKSADLPEILRVCDRLLVVFSEYKIERPELGARQPCLVFEVWKSTVCLDEPISALKAMRAKAASILMQAPRARTT